MKKRHYNASCPFLPVDFLFAAYLAVLLRITVFRSGISFLHLFEHGRWNFIPFLDYCSVLRDGGLMRFYILFFGNIGWFVPFGGYLRLRFSRLSFKAIVCAGFLFSLTIELLQFTFGTGISELDDLILNTAGAAIGAMLLTFLRKQKQNRMERRCSKDQ